MKQPEQQQIKAIEIITADEETKITTDETTGTTTTDKATRTITTN